MRVVLIPLLLLGAPILEIAVLILVGQRIGLWPTLGLVVFSGVLGAVLLKRQGFAALGRIRTETKNRRLPGRDLVHGVMILLAGILLILPGLIGDAIGLLLFLPPVRDLVWRGLSRFITVAAVSTAGRLRTASSTRARPPAEPESRRPDVIDLADRDFRRRPDSASPWASEDDRDTQGNRTLH